MSDSESSSSPVSPVTPTHPFAHATGQLEIIYDKIDIEEEARLYDDLCYDESYNSHQPVKRSRSPSPSVFSGSLRSIWFENNTGSSLAFSRDVKIAGWTSVGDKLGGAYIVYDVVIKTKEGTTIHTHKRYNAFAELESALRRTLPKDLVHFVPTLPPKNPLARYRSAFLDRRRRLLQYWLASVLLHPDIGGCQAVRQWVMD